MAVMHYRPNGLDPRTIGRMYLGTESALDGAKPTATYIVDMLTQRYAERFGEDCFQTCDVVDMTLPASVRWTLCTRPSTGLHAPARKTSDSASSFSQTTPSTHWNLRANTPKVLVEGLLIRRNPAFGNTRLHRCIHHPVHDFFKPRRESRFVRSSPT